MVGKKRQGSTIGLTLLDHLFKRPIVRVSDVQKAIERTYPIANAQVADFVEMGLLREFTGNARNRVFRYEPYLQVFGELKP